MWLVYVFIRLFNYKHVKGLIGETFQKVKDILEGFIGQHKKRLKNAPPLNFVNASCSLCASNSSHA